MPKTGRDWYKDCYEHLRRAWPSWLTAYDIARKLRSGSPPRFAEYGSGRDATKVREACEQLCEEGRAEKRHIFQEGAPYSTRPYIQYKAVMDPDTAFQEMVRETEELGLYDEEEK